MTSSTSHPSSWISDNWEALKQKRLLDITLPGSHNSGNYAGGLLSTRLCRSDYRYTEYCDTTSCPGRPPKLSEAEFDKKFIPWNVNHSAPIHAQLYQDGIRWFHLKCCNFGEPGAREVNLHQVVFQHRGYTTHETLADALSTMMHFLNEHPQEILVLGLNNLHHDCPGARFEDSDSAALAVALTAALGGDMLIDETSLFSLSLAELVTSGKRLAIFIQGQPEFLPRTVISSSRALHEGWDDVMCSGDLPGCVQWLQEELRAHGSDRSKFFVLQANPNDSEASMYRRLDSADSSVAASLEEFLLSFLRQLDRTIYEVITCDSAASHAARLVVNAISTDFLELSRPLDIALKLQGLHPRLAVAGSIPAVTPVHSE